MPRLTHDEVCSQAVKAFQATDRAAVIKAFIGSLSTRNLPARSAFGSFIVLQHFSEHAFADSTVFRMGRCAVCGLPRETKSQSADRVKKYPFQVQHTDINYAAFDLATFPKRKVDAPTDEDRKILTKLLDAIRCLPSSAQLADLNDSLVGVLKSNKHERTILLETFGYAGILCPPKQKHYSKAFVPYDLAASRQPPEFYKREWEYPVRFWIGEHGVNEKLTSKFFDRYL